jgi:MoxR-like ATPase
MTKFIGSYTKTYKSLLQASAISGINLITISTPGTGKTDMSLSAADAIGGKDGTVFIELDPSTPPEIIHGSYDPAAMLNGKLSRIVKDTPYDPAAKIVLLDEIGRSNDIVFDALVHATNQKRRAYADAPVFWGTSNFSIKGERTEALRDRFGLWYWMDADISVKDIAHAHLQNGFSKDTSFIDGLPAWDECVRIRGLRPSQRSEDLIADLIDALATEAKEKAFDVNPRRIVQWSHFLFTNTVFATGTQDFTTIPNTVLGLLKFAYPLTSHDQAVEWSKVAGSVADIVGSAIESFLAEAVAKFQALAPKSGDPSARTSTILTLGIALKDAQEQLNALTSGVGQDDPRVSEAMNQLNDIYARAVTGEPLTSLEGLG